MLRVIPKADAAILVFRLGQRLTLAKAPSKFAKVQTAHLSQQQKTLRGISPSRRTRVEQARLRQRRPDPSNFRCRDLDERRTNDGTRQLAEQYQRLLHSIVHIDEWVGVEHPRERINQVIDAARLRQIVGLYGPKQPRLKIRDDAAAAGQQATAAEHKRA